MNIENRGNFKVLLADDSRASHILMRAILNHIECPLVSAMNGSEAVEKIKEGNRYSLIFMDSHMPVMDGITAVCEIRKYEDQNGMESTPIVMMSADDAPSEIKEFIDAGASDYLRKPASKEDILSMLNNFLDINNRVQKSGNEVAESRNQTIQTELSHPAPENGSDVVFIEEELAGIVPIYIQRRKNDVTVLKEALADKDFPVLKNKGHSLKGSGGGYGMFRLTELGAQLEVCAKSEDSAAACRIIDEIEKYLQNVVVKFR